MNNYGGKRLFGSWYIPDINKPIGIGGFGRVYELRSYVVPNSVTAVKIISIPKNQDEYEQQRAKIGVSEQKVQDDFRKTKDALINELEMMLNVSGFTNCVSCMAYSVEEHEEGFGWDILIQMEKLESLDSYFRRKGEIYDTDIIQLGIDMCSALETCELNNIVHRDIKPANIMVKNINGKTIYKLGDFGVARTLSDSGTMTISGTFGYMAPELLKGEGDLRVDIYSLGMVMYELLNANRFPFYPDYPQEVSTKDVSEAQIKWNRDIPKPDPLYSMGTDLAKVVQKACEYDREKRYRSAAEMRSDLQKVLAENRARLIFTVPVIGAYKPSERKLLVKISGNCETAVYDGREHRAEGFTSNADSHNVKVQLAPGCAALAKGTKAGKYMMGLTKESFIVSPGDSRLAVEDVLVKDGMLIIEEDPNRKAKQKPVKPTEGKPEKPRKEPKAKPEKPEKPKNKRGLLILACLAVVIIAAGAFFLATYEKEEPAAQFPVTAISAGSFHTVGLREDGTVVITESGTDRQSDVAGWTDIVAVSAGFHTAGLKSDGTVVITGDDENDKREVSGWTDIVAISANGYNTVGLKSDGTVVATGKRGEEVSDWTDIIAISAGTYDTFGLKSDGTVVAAGENRFGECDVSGWTDIVEISAGSGHTVGLKSDGTLVTAGSNYYGECDVGDWTDIIAISAGDSYTVGLKSDGTVVATDATKIKRITGNYYGECDVGDWTDIIAISAGSYHTVGLKSDGTAVATGLDCNGKHDVVEWPVLQSPQQTEGNNAAQERAEPSAPAELPSRSPVVAISAGSFHTAGLKPDGTVVTTEYGTDVQSDVAGWTDIVAISAGFHTAGLKSDGTVVITKVDEDREREVSGWTDIVAISANSYNTVGLKSDGTVVATGKRGEAVSDWTDIVAISAGDLDTVGLKSDGTVVAAGENRFGECDVSDWTDIVAISSAFSHTVGLKSDGTLVTAGSNFCGQCDVSDWTDIIAISTGTGYTIGLKSDGSVVATEYNKNYDYYGQCDVTGWTDIVAISAGSEHTVGLKADGTVVATGRNYDRQCAVTDW